MSIRNRENRKKKRRRAKAHQVRPTRPETGTVELLQAVIGTAYPILEEFLSPRCCVPGTQIVQAVLASHGVETTRAATDLVITTAEYRRRMGAFVKANPDSSVTATPDVLDQWEAEGAISACTVGNPSHVFEVIHEGGFVHHMILRVAPGLYLDPTIGQYKHRGLDVPKGLLMAGDPSAPEIGVELPNSIQAGWTLRPEVRMPPRYTSSEILDAEHVLRQALAELGYKAAA